MSEIAMVVEEIQNLRSTIEDLKGRLLLPKSPKLSQVQAQKYVRIGRDTFNREVILGRIKKRIGANGETYYLDYELDKYLEGSTSPAARNR